MATLFAIADGDNTEVGTKAGGLLTQSQDWLPVLSYVVT